MALPEIILLRNRQRLRAKAGEAIAKAKLIEEITEVVHLLNLEIQEEKEGLTDLMKQMKKIASTLDEADPADGSSHLQSVLKDAADALGEKHLRLHSEIGNILSKKQGSDSKDSISVPKGTDRSALALKPEGGVRPSSESNAKKPEVAPPVVGSEA